MNYSFVVKCGECNEEHLTSEVEFVNIEENFYGEDVAYFICPVNEMTTQSRVYRL
jgi:hypothetical protein